ncbi:MAG: putative zinc-binding metallopeptidase [Candidatus Devosia symbiotica]|nr:putative zinc-binding metallopeptidase [Candidatus Devosia symbiotica]
MIRARPGGDPFCAACRHNNTILDMSNPLNLARWQVIEPAKKRLFYSLLWLNLPLQTRASNPEHGLSFRFLADTLIAKERVLTGHDNSIITIDLVEADDAEREARRTTMGEPYRILLSHFRYEIGHHCWELLVDARAPLTEFRRLFGDDTADYAEALEEQEGADDGGVAGNTCRLNGALTGRIDSGDGLIAPSLGFSWRNAGIGGNDIGQIAAIGFGKSAAVESGLSKDASGLVARNTSLHRLIGTELWCRWHSHLVPRQRRPGR